MKTQTPPPEGFRPLNAADAQDRREALAELRAVHPHRADLLENFPAGWSRLIVTFLEPISAADYFNIRDKHGRPEVSLDSFTSAEIQIAEELLQEALETTCEVMGWPEARVHRIHGRSAVLHAEVARELQRLPDGALEMWRNRSLENGE